MNKSYKKYVLVGLSTISVSLMGSEKSQRSQLQQSDGNTWVLQPLGGYIQLEQHSGEDVRKFYNDYTIEKTIHYSVVNRDNMKNPAYKKGILSAVPFKLFTEEGKSYTVTYNHIPVTIISDQVYDEKSFDTYHDYWNNIHSKKYSYDEYMKKISNNNQ